MFSDPATIRTELRDRLKPLLPATWRIIDNLSQAVDTVVTVLYFEFTEVSSSVNGAALDRFTVAPKFDLVVASAGAGDEDGADADLVTLAHALQQCDDIYWDTAKKERLSNGAIAWRFPLTLLSTIEE
ncbi:hypothetical protein [Microbacterium hominis]|uniref:hypothetical protein n=1 Tax=Microbacterium hominis TaxID=162426 RepID=UPI00076884F0|nr:hypothetical protein [Microbacterium hominis]KXC05770.1 hypothetical protein MhomT_09215 [Microbacterium hominis]